VRRLDVGSGREGNNENKSRACSCNRLVNGSVSSGLTPGWLFNLHCEHDLIAERKMSVSAVQNRRVDTSSQFFFTEKVDQGARFSSFRVMPYP
jgi:hypothetical protein